MHTNLSRGGRSHPEAGPSSALPEEQSSRNPHVLNAPQHKVGDTRRGVRGREQAWERKIYLHVTFLARPRERPRMMLGRQRGAGGAGLWLRDGCRIERAGRLGEDAAVERGAGSEGGVVLD